MRRDAALPHWIAPGKDTFVAVDEERILGLYCITPIRSGGGSHVSNCGFVTAVEARGRGVARRMCEHAIEYARARGFRAMQFNFVVSTNEAAVHLWQSLGLQIVGTLPGAFEHPKLGEVDAYVMYRRL